MESKIKKIIILLVIIIIILALIILMLMQENRNSEEPDLEIGMITKKQNNKYVNDIIDKYIEYCNENAIQQLQEITNSNDQYNIFTDIEQGERINYYINEMYEIDNLAGSIYFVQLKAIDRVDIYVIINVDYTNCTYQIIKSSEKEYEKMKNNVVDEKYKQYTMVEKKKYNTFIL